MNVTGNLSKTQKTEEKKRMKWKKDQASKNCFDTTFELPKTKENLLVGDTILFVPPIYGQAHPRRSYNKQKSTVISVDPDACGNSDLLRV